MPFNLGYSDYARLLDGAPFQMSESQFNALSPEEQAQQLTFASQNANNGGMIYRDGMGYQYGGQSEAKDPSQVQTQGGWHGNPMGNFRDDQFGVNYGMMAVPLLAGAGAAMMGGEAAAGGEAGKGGGGAWDGTFGAGGLDPETLAGAGGMGGSPAGAVTGGVPWDGGLGAGGLDPETLGGAGGMGGGSTPWYQGILDGASANPLSTAVRALGLGQTVAGLIGGGGGGSGGGSSYEPTGKGGSGQALKQTPLTVNPYTLSQVQNYRPIAPRRMI